MYDHSLTPKEREEKAKRERNETIAAGIFALVAGIVISIFAIVLQVIMWAVGIIIALIPFAIIGAGIYGLYLLFS